MRQRAFIGCDAHRQDSSFVLVVQDSGGNKRRMNLGTVATQPSTLREFFRRLSIELAEHWPATLVVEAMGGPAMMVHEAAVEFVDDVWVVDCYHVSVLRRRRAKTDRSDATLLAELALDGLVEPLWVPCPRVYGMRALARTRRSFVAQRTAVANRLRAMAAVALAMPIRGSVWSAANMQLLSTAPWPTEPARYAGESLIAQMAFCSQQISYLNDRIAEIFAASRQAQLIASIPGASKVLAVTIASEIGDIRRFESAGHLRSFAGLAPRVHESAGRRRGGGTVKHGNRHLKWALVQVVHQITRYKRSEEPLAERFWRYFGQVAGAGGMVRAKVRMASWLCQLVYALLRDDRYYQKR